MFAVVFISLAMPPPVSAQASLLEISSTNEINNAATSSVTMATAGGTADQTDHS